MLFVNALGGLALFLFGMKLMSRGLQKAAGEKMRTVLRFFSSNREKNPFRVLCIFFSKGYDS